MARHLIARNVVSITLHKFVFHFTLIKANANLRTGKKRNGKRKKLPDDVCAVELIP